MAKLSLPGGSLQCAASCRGVRVGVVCALGALLVSCATGMDIRDDVQFVEFSPEDLASPAEGVENTRDPSTADPVAPEGATGGVQASTSEAEGGAAELPLAPGEMS